jgi:hypothetical protein
MRTFRWVSSCFAIYLLLAATSAFAGIIEEYPLATNAVGLYNPGIDDLIPEGGVTFTAGACGAAAYIPSYNIVGACNTGTNPTALVAPASLMSAMSGLSAYSIQMDFTAGPGVSFDDYYYDLYAASYGGPSDVCTENQGENGDLIILSVGSSPAGYAEVIWVLGNSPTGYTAAVRTGDVLDYSECNNLNFVFDGTYYYIYINGILEAGPTTGTSGTGQIGSLLLQVTDGGYNSPNFTTSKGGGWISNLVFSNLETTPTLTPTMTPSPSPSPTPTATPTPTPACPTYANGIARLPQGSGAPWANVIMPTPVPVGYTAGDHQTIAYIGCYLTCFAMIDPDKKETPAVLDAIFTNRGDINSAGDLFGDGDAANYLGFNISGTPFKNDNSDAENLIAENVGNSDTYVIVGIQMAPDEQHYVLITGESYSAELQSCSFSIDDPASADYQYLDEYTNTDGLPIAVVEILTPEK